MRAIAYLAPSNLIPLFYFYFFIAGDDRVNIATLKNVVAETYRPTKPQQIQYVFSFLGSEIPEQSSL